MDLQRNERGTQRSVFPLRCADGEIQFHVQLAR